MDRPSRRVMPGWPSFAALLLAGAYLTVRWDSIPERWIIHWGPRGEPNGWASKSGLGVYGLLVLGAVIAATSEAVGRARGSGREPVRATSLYLARLMTFGAALMLAFLSVDLPLGPPMPLAARLSIAVAPLLVAMLLGVRRLSAALRETRESGEGAKYEGYHGVYYANANDRRLWVPKIHGVGWTLNFSHPLAWPVFLLLVGVPIGLVILSVAAR